MRRFPRSPTAAAVLVLLGLTLPSAAFGQATRTWVSGVGDDANPCSRTAPCKTFAGAISKTASGGEINCLDPGGFGGVTITKALTIKCHYTEGGVLVAGTNAIVINAAATDKVTLRGLDINGVGTGAQTSLVGIKVLSARSVHIIDSEVYRFKAGISLQSTVANSKVIVDGSHIHDNGIGVFNGAGNNAATPSTITLRNNIIAENTCNVVASAFGANASTPDPSTNCGTATAATGILTGARINAFDNLIGDADNIGILSRGNTAIVRIGGNIITNNAVSMLSLNTGAIKSFQDNYIDGNAATNPPTATGTTS